MSRLLLFSLFVLAVAGCGVHAQVSPSGSRAGDLASALDKTKYKKKEKNGIAFEFYIDVRNRLHPPAAGPDEFSGSYVCESGEYKLDLTIAADGTARGSGADTDTNGDKQMAFTLRDARVDGPLLQATKVYSDGTTEVLNAVFVDRTTTTGRNAQAIDSTTTEFGIGFIRTEKAWTSRLFLKRN